MVGKYNNEQTVDEIEEEFIFPASYAQSRLWVMDQLIKNKAVYNIASTISIEGRLNESILEKSLNEIIKRHEILRTNFEIENGELKQIIKSKLLFKLDVEDLLHLNEPEKGNRCSEIERKEALHQFNLSNTPLIRAVLVRLAPGEFKLLMTMHHIIADGWSVGLFIQELSALYESWYRGSEPNLPILEIQYADFSEWEKKWLKDERLDRQLEYWKEQLQGELPVLELPTDRPRPNTQNFKGSIYECRVPLDLTESLRNLSNHEGATLYMTLLAAFQTLLHRLSGQHEVLVGSPVANRNQEEIENLIGCFVNNIVIRTNFSDNPTFLQLLQNIKKITKKAYINQEAPFERVAEIINHEKSNSLSPLFQTMFVLQTTPRVNFELPDLKLLVSRNQNETSKYDLTLDMMETEDGLVSVFEYNTELFDESTIVRWANHFITLLKSIVEDANVKVSKIPILSPEENSRIIELNNKKLMFDKEVCIHQLFEQQVKRSPDDVALTFMGKSLTYLELNQQSNQLANYLIRQGIRHEDLIGICLDRSMEMVISILGILKAGGAYVPIDPSYPKERIAHLIEDSKISLLITKEFSDFELPEHNAETILLDLDGEKIALESSENRINISRSNSLAYVIYTSGSTGKPKGVLVSHENVVRLFKATDEWFSFNRTDVWTMFHSYSFDFSVWEIWGALINGGRLVLVPYWVSRSPEEFYQLLIDEKVTVLNQTPSAFKQLAQVDGKEGLMNHSSLRYVIFGGEALDIQSLGSWFDRNGDKNPQLINMYGITEMTVHVSYRPITINDLNNQSSVIGKAIPDLEIFILDKNFQPVPIGVYGEIFVGGDGVARGYLNRSKLTKERFINISLLGQERRLYRSGDLARYLSNGDLEYLGRIDNQVKIRGFRIEIGEIESILSQNKNINEHAVVVREDTPGNKQLVAYLSLVEKDKSFLDELRKFLKERLPDYMNPSIIIELDKLPLTPNGKIDRKALLETSLQVDMLTNSFIEPTTPFEKKMTEIWSSIFGIEKIGINDNFFEMGGHSLLAAKLIWEVRERLGVELSLQELFLNPTIAELSQYQLREVEVEIAQKMKIKLRNDRTSHPLSFAQKGIWFQEQIKAGNSVYNMPLPLKIKGKLNISALEGSFTKLITRHEVLRATFITQNGVPIQVVKKPYSFAFKMDNISNVDHEEISHKIKEESFTSFDLPKGPLIRAKLLYINDEEYILIITIHHIIGDAISFKNIVKEVISGYFLLANDYEHNLPELKIQFSDFSEWQNEWIDSEDCQKQLSYWINQLDNAPANLKLPTDFPRPDIQSFKGESIDYNIPEVLANELRELSKNEGITLFMLLMAAWNVLLYRYSNQRDILVGTSASGRNQDTEELVGPFINTLPIRTKLHSNLSFLDLMRSVKDTTLDSFTNQDVPFELVLNHLKVERDPSRFPLCQTFLSYQLHQNELEQPSNLIFERMPLQLVGVQFDIVLDFIDRFDVINGRFEYCTELFERTSIRKMINHYLELLRNVVKNPNEKIKHLSYETAEEQIEKLDKEIIVEDKNRSRFNKIKPTLIIQDRK
ncbi:amino acid adenylation domain-containing protein [Peribacillus frigoritolerans]|uniref:amino acid adenylation domain-containing protein n=1 Tax=Peribacillus frigoritolerans TaxID=450367 RepID=UPI002EC29DB2|nr:amino acid adenylation domain-containing protein [Peribacillus frigoritolerans]